MKKGLLLTGLLMTFFVARTQEIKPLRDTVYLLNGDSIAVTIPGDPRKETRLDNKTIGGLDDYGFLQIIAVYPNDSLRIYTPGKIAGYRRFERGKFIGSGYFESRVLDTRIIGYGNRASNRLVFLHRVAFAHDYTLWYYRDGTLDVVPDHYFLLEKKGMPAYLCFTSWKHWNSWAKNTPPFSEIIQKIPPPKKKKDFVPLGFAYLQELFNQLQNQYHPNGTKVENNQ